MFLLVPYRTDTPIRRTPYVNMALIGINVIVFIATSAGSNGLSFSDTSDSALLEWGQLNPRNLALYQFFSYQFLHGHFWHLFGNMLFLWVFGNAVNSKMGNVAYLLFYLAAGVFAAAGFLLTSDSPLIGASGAIAGVTTAFLVLYPHSQIDIFCWVFLFIRIIHVQAMLLIVLKIIVWDNIVAPSLYSGASNVAYEAHIAGYLFGFALCFMLLLLKALPRDQYDILALVKRYNQRRQFRAMMADPNAASQATFGRVAMPVSVFTGRPVAAPAADDAIIRLRHEISDRLSRSDMDGAVEKYEALVARDPSQVLARRNMRDIANQLKLMQKYPQAVAAYEKFLAAYPDDSEAPHVRMLLGILYTRYLQQHERAEALFRQCRDQLADPQLRETTEQWLDAVLAILGKPPGGATGPSSQPSA